jgi:hypothetical protein
MDAAAATIGRSPPVREPVAVAMDGGPAVEHLLTIGGLPVAQRNAVMNVEGIQTIAALHNIFPGDVKQMTENLSRLAVNRGGAYIGVSITASIKALIWWIQDSNTQGSVDPNNWNADALNDDRQRMLLEKQGHDKEDDLVEAPKKLDPTKWVDSYLKFLKFLLGQTQSSSHRMGTNLS